MAAMGMARPSALYPIRNTFTRPVTSAERSFAIISW
jgi:hypothetical protein